MQISVCRTLQIMFFSLLVVAAGIMVAMTQEPFSELSAQALLALGLATFLVFGLATIVIVLVEWRLLRPLRRVSAQMARLANGDTDLVLPKLPLAIELRSLVEILGVLQQGQRDRQRLEHALAEDRQREIERQQEIDAVLTRFQAAIGDLHNIVKGQHDVMHDVAASLTSGCDSSRSGADAARTIMQMIADKTGDTWQAADQLVSARRVISTQAHFACTRLKAGISAARMAEADMKALSAPNQAFAGVIRSIAEKAGAMALSAARNGIDDTDIAMRYAALVSDVKALASESANALEGLSWQVAQVQKMTQKVSGSLDDASGIMLDVEAAGLAIAAAVEQQDAPMRHIVQAMLVVSENAERACESLARMEAVSMLHHAQAETLDQAALQLGGAAGLLAQSSNQLIGVIARDMRERKRVSRLSTLQISLVLGNNRRAASKVLAAAAKDVTVEAVPQLVLGNRLQLEWSTGARAHGRIIWVGSEQAGIALDSGTPAELLELARAA